MKKSIKIDSSVEEIMKVRAVKLRKLQPSRQLEARRQNFNIGKQFKKKIHNNKYYSCFECSFSCRNIKNFSQITPSPDSIRGRECYNYQPHGYLACNTCLIERRLEEDREEGVERSEPFMKRISTSGKNMYAPERKTWPKMALKMGFLTLGLDYP